MILTSASKTTVVASNKRFNDDDDDDDDDDYYYYYYYYHHLYINSFQPLFTTIITNNTLSSIPQLSPSLSPMNEYDKELLSSNKNDNINQNIPMIYSEQSIMKKNEQTRPEQEEEEEEEEKEEEKQQQKIKKENDSIQTKRIFNDRTDH
ncbi:unnamed protein product, partial [Schistosoma mattheei]